MSTVLIVFVFFPSRINIFRYTQQVPQESATVKARRVNRKAEQPRGCRTVFIKNLPYDVDEDGVHEALAVCGRIASVRLAMWNHTRKLKVGT